MSKRNHLRRSSGRRSAFACTHPDSGKILGRWLIVGFSLVVWIAIFKYLAE